MKGFKIWVADLSKDECEAVQLALYTLGYAWASGEDKHPLYTNIGNELAYIASQDSGILYKAHKGRDWEELMGAFQSRDLLEIKLTDIFRG